MFVVACVTFDTTELHMSLSQHALHMFTFESSHPLFYARGTEIFVSQHVRSSFEHGCVGCAIDTEHTHSSAGDKHLSSNRLKTPSRALLSIATGPRVIGGEKETREREGGQFMRAPACSNAECTEACELRSPPLAARRALLTNFVSTRSPNGQRLLFVSGVVLYALPRTKAYVRLSSSYLDGGGCTQKFLSNVFSTSNQAKLDPLNCIENTTKRNQNKTKEYAP